MLRQKSVAKSINDSHQSGKLNLSNCDLDQLPNELFEDGQDQSVDFKRETTPWWEYADLTVLIASENRLRMLDSRINRFNRLSVLHLQNNQIVNLPDLDDFTDLQRIYLNNNLIQKIPESWTRLPLIELNLQGNRLTQLPSSIFEMSTLQNLNVSNNQLTGGIITRNCSRLRILNASNNKLSFADFELDSLQDVDLSHNQITHLSDLSVPNLLKLDIGYNSLCDLPNVNAPQLRDLILGFNRVRDVKPGTLVAPNLVTFDIRENCLGSLPLDCLSMSKLKRLDITNNSISRIPPELSLLTELLSFLYSGNRIRGIGSNLSTFEILESLGKKLDSSIVDRQVPTKIVSKSNNGIIELQGQGLVEICVKDILELESRPLEVNLAQNSISYIPPLFVDSLKSLQRLNISRNKLVQFSPFSLDSLTTLNLSGNMLKMIPLVNASNLIELNLCDNQICEWNTLKCPRLNCLLLSGNKLETIEMSIVSTLLSLQTLDVSNNSLSKVPVDLGKMNLHRLELMGNPFRVPRM